MGFYEKIKGVFGYDAPQTNAAGPLANGPVIKSALREAPADFNHASMISPGAFGYGDSVDILEYTKDHSGALATDQLFSNGWLAGLIDASIGQVIGDGLRPNVKPNIAVLGWTPEQANTFSKEVEALFSLYCETPTEIDYSGRQSFAGMQRTLMRSYYGSGEGLAVLPYKPASRAMFGSRVQLLDVARLSTSIDGLDQQRDGVYFQGGVQKGIVIQDRDPATQTENWEAKKIPFYSRTGRPLSTLVFDHVVPQQVRGITPMLPVLRLIKQHEKLIGSNLALNQLYTSLGITITSGATSEEVMQALTNSDSDQEALKNFVATKAQFYKGQTNMLGGYGAEGHIPVTHLLPGETLDLKNIPQNADNLADFNRLLMLAITRALGVSYELSGDYDGATYSSVRMSTATNWPLVLQRRKNIVVPFCNAVFFAWLEEVLLRGLITIPGGITQFHALRPAFKVDWQGPAAPQADEQKSAKAMQTRLEIGVTSLAEEAAARGSDWQEILEQRKREKDYAEKLGLPDPHTSEETATPTVAPERKTVTVNGSERSLTYHEMVDLLDDRQNDLAAMKTPSDKRKLESHNRVKATMKQDIKTLSEAIEELQQ